MSKKANPTIIGAFVLGAIALTVAGGERTHNGCPGELQGGESRLGHKYQGAL